MTDRKFIVISFGAIGDALMLISLLDAVHAQHPATKLHFFAARNGALPQQLGERYSFIRFSNLKSLRGVVDALTLFASSNIFLIPPSFGTIPPHIKLFGTLLSRMPRSLLIGFKDESSHAPYGITCTYDDTATYYENLRRALYAGGIAIPDAIPRYRIDSDQALLRTLSLTERTYVVVHPYAANKKRGLPPSKLRSILTHLKDDQADAKRYEEYGARSLAGSLSLQETAALLKDAALYIGVDTGITHLASLLRIPSVVIANRSNPSWLPTYNENACVLTESSRCGCTGDKKGSCSVEENGQEYFRCAYDVTDSLIQEAIAERVAHEAVSA
jgi:ADP-heptose:LPS heptosyltransferase